MCWDRGSSPQHHGLYHVSLCHACILDIMYIIAGSLTDVCGPGGAYPSLGLVVRYAIPIILLRKITFVVELGDHICTAV